MQMFRKLSSQIVIDLGELEGDYRAFNLPVDKAQAVLAMAIAGVAILALLGLDAALFGSGSVGLIRMMVSCIFYILFTGAVIFFVARVDKVRLFDRLVFAWILGTILYLLWFNVIGPDNYLATSYDIITLFAIYALSPLKFQSNLFLVSVFSAGTIYIDYFVKTGVGRFDLVTAISALVIVHILGLGSSLQLHSYRRRSFKAYVDERDAKEMVAYLANIDPLTKSLTRRHFFNIAESEFKRFARYHRPFSVLVIDADHFKKINDEHGHHAGDIVLRSFSLVAMEQKRVQDTFGRLGGEEFGLILPETKVDQAQVVAERIQTIWGQTPSNMDGITIYSTVSIGVAEVRDSDTSFDDVLKRADLMMYKAKDQGRNRVVAE